MRKKASSVESIPVIPLADRAFGAYEVRCKYRLRLGLKMRLPRWANLSAPVLRFYRNAGPAPVLDHAGPRSAALAPALIIDPPAFNLAMSEGQTADVQYTLKNAGLISLFNVEIAQEGSNPNVEFVTQVKSIPELKAGQSVVVPARIRLIHSSCEPFKRMIIGTYKSQCGEEVGVVDFVYGTVGDCTGGTAPGPYVRRTGGGGYFSMGGGSDYIAKTPASGGSVSSCATTPQGDFNTWRVNGQKRGVDISSGNLHIGDCSCSAASCPLRPNPQYNSINPKDSDMGHGWTGEYRDSLSFDENGNMTVTDSDGTERVFVSLGAFNPLISGSADSPFGSPQQFRKPTP